LRLFRVPILVVALLGVPTFLHSVHLIRQVQPWPDIVFAKWTLGPEPLTVEPIVIHPLHHPGTGGVIPEPETTSRNINLSDSEMQRLRSAGITGHLKIVSEMGANGNARAVIIMYQQLDAPFSFLAPAEHADVIYLQTPQGWRKLPPDASESDRPIRLYIPSGKPSQTGANGTEHAFDW
jgi:hypothetical protein